MEKQEKKKNEKTANLFGESSSVVFVVGLEQADEVVVKECI